MCMSESANIRVLLRNCLLACLVLVAVASCHSGEDSHTDRTILVYMAGDNNLCDYLNRNIREMGSGISNRQSHNHVVVFVDRPGKQSCLIDVKRNGNDTVRVWNENLNSASPALLSEVIDYVTGRFAADSYGLVLWSHATGWIPSSAHKFIDSGKLSAPGPKQGNGDSDRPYIRRPFEGTRAILVDNSVGSYSWMEYDEMAEAIPDSLFDFIMFDACFMGSAEVAYELRGKAHWMIASAVEVLTTGFPYDIVTEPMIDGDYETLCRRYFDYYNSKSGDFRTAGIALINLDSYGVVADAFADVVRNASVSVDDLSNVQCDDRFRRSVMFDLLDVAERLEPGEEYVQRMKEALDEAIVYHANTEYVVSEIHLNRYCGLNCYIPYSRYGTVINPYYSRTEWNRRVGFIE